MIAIEVGGMESGLRLRVEAVIEDRGWNRDLGSDGSASEQFGRSGWLLKIL